MTKISLSLILALVLLSGLGAAALAEPLETAEKQRTLLLGHSVRLEQMLAEQSKRIARLKSQAPGVRRDLQLEGALRENQTLATKLTRLRSQIRTATEKLIAAYTEAGKRAGVPQRAALERRRQALLDELSSGPGRIITREQASPLDTPEDLEEKADLLQDSAEKVRRQLRQVATKLSALEHRARLERHGKAMDDNPFVEDSPRRSGGARKVGGGATGAAPASPSASGGMYNGKANESDRADFAPGGIDSSPPPAVAPKTEASGEVLISIRDVMDPSILKDPANPGSASDLRSRIAALKQAGARLGQMAQSLSTQASDLRQRAKSLRKTR